MSRLNRWSRENLWNSYNCFNFLGFYKLIRGANGGPGTFLSFDEFKVRLGPSIVTGVIALHDLTVGNPYVNRAY